MSESIREFGLPKGFNEKIWFDAYIRLIHLGPKAGGLGEYFFSLTHGERHRKERFEKLLSIFSRGETMSVHRQNGFILSYKGRHITLAEFDKMNI